MKPVPYAGFDPDEGRRADYSTTRSKRAYRLFQAGVDTFDISKRLKVRENVALKYITIERSLRLGYPSPYGRS